MSIILQIKDNKIHPLNNVLLECNICLQNNSKIQKCFECEFNICNSCLIKWYKFNYNNECPHCKKKSTYIEPITTRKRFNICCKRLKENIMNIINIINRIIKEISNIIISFIFNETFLDRINKITICFGISLFFLVYLSLYSLMVFCMVTITLLIIICLYHTCCCICCNNNVYCCYIFYHF